VVVTASLFSVVMAVSFVSVIVTAFLLNVTNDSSVKCDNSCFSAKYDTCYFSVLCTV
jgi:hypothetical protein